MQLCGSSCFRQKLFHSKHFGVEYGETALQDPINNLGCDHDTQHAQADELYDVTTQAAAAGKIGSAAKTMRSSSNCALGSRVKSAT